MAERAAAGRRRILVSASAEVEPVDPAALAFGSRRADDRWFVWEQPERDGFAIATLGSARELVSRGPDRARDLVADAAETMRGRLSAGPESACPAAGPLWVGGMSFWPDGCSTPPWSGFEPALLVLPELSVVRHRDTHVVTIAALAGPGIGAGELRERLAARLASLRSPALPLLDPRPGEVEVASARPPAAYERAVADAVAAIRSGVAEKLVLAREVLVTAAEAYAPAALHGALRELFASCFCFCWGSPQAAFAGASPELLVRRSGAVAATVALAGSARRSADPAVDDHLGEALKRSSKDASEHAIVVRRIQRRLEPFSVWVELGGEPEVVKVANIQHLATPVHAQLADPRSALELAALLHPTPAVGAEPAGAGTERLIRDAEAMDRGWYAGPVGWMDAAEDGEFCVALRSALLRDRTAHLYAGAGIVADSEPAAELAETEVKLGALLPLLAG